MKVSSLEGLRSSWRDVKCRRVSMQGESPLLAGGSMYWEHGRPPGAARGPWLTVSKKTEISVYSHKELNSADNLRKLQSKFFPRNSRKKPSLISAWEAMRGRPS